MVLVDLRDHLIRCSDVTWVERSERTMFPSTLTYFTLCLSTCLCTCLVSYLSFFRLAAKGSREEGVDEEKIEKDAKVRRKNMR